MTDYTVIDRILGKINFLDLPTIEQLAKLIQDNCPEYRLEETCEMITLCLYHTDIDECKKMDSFNRLKEIIGF